MFCGRLDQNSGGHANRKLPLTYNGENGVSTFSRLLLFVCVGVLRPVNKEVMSSWSVNSGTIPGQA